MLVLCWVLASDALSALSIQSGQPGVNTMLAAADAAGHVLLWDVVTATVLHTFRPGKAVRTTTSNRKHPGAFDESSPLQPPSLHGGAINTLEWSRDGRFLVVIVFARFLVVYDVLQRRMLWKREFPERLLTLKWDPFDSTRACLATVSG